MKYNASKLRNCVLYPVVRPTANKKLFCFPFAGNGASIYLRWAERISDNIEVCPIELPGRGRRFRDPLLHRFSDVIESLSEAILPHLNKPFAFFGHSMGALISFELSRYFSAKYNITPEYLFVSACPAPQLYSSETPVCELSDAEFLRKLKELNGLPEEITRNEELLQVFLPILRADFSVCDTYSFNEGRKLNCPVAVFGGANDNNITLQELHGWNNTTCREFSMEIFPGDHFFILKEEEQITKKVIELFNRLTDTETNRYVKAI